MFVYVQAIQYSTHGVNLLNIFVSYRKSASIPFSSLHNMFTGSVYKIITTQACLSIGRCVLMRLHSLSHCNNGTAFMDRILCFVDVYSKLICLHSVKFCVNETIV